MSSSRRKMYVEILYDPNKRRTAQQRSPELSPSLSADMASDDAPRRRSKRRRLSPSPSANSNNSLFDEGHQISPTLSEFGPIASGSRTTPPETRSPTFSEQVADSVYERNEQETKPFIYDLTDDDVDENEDLVVLGESQGEDDEDDEELPVRMLYDFAVYASDTLEVVSIAELLQVKYSARRYRASGLVRPWFASDDDADGDSENEGEDEGESPVADQGRDRVSLSDILEFSVYSEAEGDYPIDPKIYVRTEFAWYILGSPCKQYQNYFVPFWTCHRMLYLVIIACLDDSRINYEQFLKVLARLDEAEDSVLTAETLLGREFSAVDFESEEVSTYIVSNLRDICTEGNIQISRVPLVKDLLGPVQYQFDVEIPKSKTNQMRKDNMQKHQSSIQKKKKQKQDKTFLTPTVNQIARNFFKGSLEVATSALDEDVQQNQKELREHKAHHSNPEAIVWGKKLRNCDGYYESAHVDGVTYNIGDVIMVAPDSVDTATAFSVNEHANLWWFCQIRYFYEDGSSNKMFHGMWFNHGNKTLLQETSHSRALYLLGTCDSNLITAIVKKCNFTILRPDEKEHSDDGACMSNDFHCGLYCKDEGAAFVDLPEDALTVIPGTKVCFSCSLKAENSAMEQIKYDGKNLDLQGITYHEDDFVYLIPPGSTKLLNIGQITKITEMELTVCLLGRYDDYVTMQKSMSKGQELVFDERRLFYTNNIVKVPPTTLVGICYVLHLTVPRAIEKWVIEDDHYYLSEQGSVGMLEPMEEEDVAQCEVCFLRDQAIRKQRKVFLQTNSKLVGFELFSGAGGLGVGMDLSGYVETKYAVEFSPSAAATYIANHPNTTVYCQDSSSLLKHALTGNPKDKLLSLDQKTYCPPLPKKGAQIDFIFGGPPCQSFSFANHSKREDDIRSTISCNMLSYVEHYEPSYFLLENVVGFLAHKFRSHRDTPHGPVETEIQCGMVKLVMRTLIALGYQVRFKALQGAQYGVPQSRRRVIFWGAKRGLPIPEFPVPMYAHKDGMHGVNLPTGSKANPPTRSKDPDNAHQYAPLKPITVDAAIGDLPAFDWKNPHLVHPQTAAGRREAQKRIEELEIPSFPAALGNRKWEWSTLPGFPNGGEYCMDPENRFQRWLRQGMGAQEKVTGQYTTKFSARVVEATCTVPLVAGAYHRDLPRDLVPEFAFKDKKSKRILYGRMDANGLFKCATTQLSPLLKNQWPLHPSQKRIVTVREAARCQGFPDSYIFKSTDTRPAKIIEDQLKQIGNAVAVPFALALGKELGKARILAWEQQVREGSVAL